MWSAPDPRSVQSALGVMYETITCWFLHCPQAPPTESMVQSLAAFFVFALGFHPPTTTPFTALPHERNDVSYTHVILWSLNITDILIKVWCSPKRITWLDSMVPFLPFPDGVLRIISLFLKPSGFNFELSCAVAQNFECHFSRFAKRTILVLIHPTAFHTPFYFPRSVLPPAS